MSNRRRELKTLNLYSRSKQEELLAKMAERGWLLEKIGTFFWTYRRIEPKKLTFCLCCFPKASAFDPEPSEDQQTFYEFCRHTGWILAASMGQTQVFYNEAPDPVPIETDPLTEVEGIHQSFKRSLLPSYLVLLALVLLNGGMYLSRLRRDLIGVLSSSASLFSGLGWTIVLLMTAAELLGHVSWYRRAVQAAEQGEFLESDGRRWFQRVCLAVIGVGLGYVLLTKLASGDKMALVIFLLMYCVFLPGLYALVWAIKAVLKRKKVSAQVSRVVTIVSSFVLAFGMVMGIGFGVLAASSWGWFAEKDEEVYTYQGSTFTAHWDELPLTVEDLLDVRYEGYDRIRWGEETFLLGRTEVDQRPRLDAEHYREMPRLEYTVVQVKCPALWEVCKKALLAKWKDNWRPEGQKDYTVSIDPAPWRAREAYQLANQEYGPENRFLLCYGNRLVEIRFSWPPTPEQMNAVVERLGEAELP